MKWRINSITLQNFKYIHNAYTLPLNGKNLLVYGENGSGKSSFYWALYTLFQSLHKPNALEVQKYFIEGNEANLRNKYSLPGDLSKVEVDFMDLDDETIPHKLYEVSNVSLNTQTPGDIFFMRTEASCDFVNHRNLLTFTDFKNSQTNEIFDLIESEILPYANFRTGFTKIDGTPCTSHNAAELWHYINDALQYLPKQTGNRRNEFNSTTAEYHNYETLLPLFVSELSFYLNELAQRTNNILKNHFNLSEVEVEFVPNPIIEFNLPTAHGSRHRDHRLHKYEVVMKATLHNGQLPGAHVTEINHLRSFFNEAKLMCIGLAIRLAVIDMKPTSSAFPSIICADDILLSLDMAYRMPVLETLMDYAVRDTHQLIIFTHDYALYKIWCNIIENRHISQKWQKYEMYAQSRKTAAVQEPSLIIKKGKDLYEQVQFALESHNYPLAANCLRKYGESIFKKILPLNFHGKFDSRGEYKQRMFKELHDELHKSVFLNLYNFESTDFPDMTNYLQRLLNPLSHDDKDVQIYRDELENCLMDMQGYKDIAATKNIICDRALADNKKYRLSLANAGISVSLTFTPIEQWDFFVIGANLKLKDVEVKVLASAGAITFPVGAKMLIKDIYARIKGSLFGGGGAPRLQDVVLDTTDGQTLSAKFGI